MASALRLPVLAAGAAAAAAQWNQFTRCALTGTCVTFTLSLSNVQPSAFWSLGTTIPFSEEVVEALNLPANGVNMGDIGNIIPGSQTNQVGLNYVLIQRTDNGDLIYRGADPQVAGSIADTKVGFFNGGGPQYVSQQALLATTNVYYQYSGATTVDEANKIGSRIFINKAKICDHLVAQLAAYQSDPWADGLTCAITMPVGFPAGPTPLPSAAPSIAAGTGATVNYIHFVFNIVGASPAKLSSASGRAALESALAAAIMVGPNFIAGGGTSSGEQSTGRVFDMTTLIKTVLTPSTLSLTSALGSEVYFRATSARRLNVAEDQEAAGPRELQSSVPIEWHASVTFGSPQVAFQVGQLLVSNRIAWATTLATSLTAVDAANFPANSVTTSLAQPIMYPLGPSFSPSPSPSATKGAAAGVLNAAGSSSSSSSSSSSGELAGLAALLVVPIGAALWYFWKRDRMTQRSKAPSAGKSAAAGIASTNPLRSAV